MSTLHPPAVVSPRPDSAIQVRKIYLAVELGKSASVQAGYPVSLLVVTCSEGTDGAFAVLATTPTVNIMSVGRTALADTGTSRHMVATAFRIAKIRGKQRDVVFATMSRAVNERPRREISCDFFFHNDRIEIVSTSLQVMVVPELGARIFSVGALDTAEP